MLAKTCGIWYNVLDRKVNPFSEAGMKLTQFSPNEYRPTGWLRRQLEIQASSLSGHLDLMWADIKDSAWIGGDHEGWERVPYWLDGFIPLAHLLGDEDLIARSEKYVNGILDRQKESGWICPCDESQAGTYDLWAAFLIGKVLALYCDFTGNKRAEDALYREMKNLLGHLKNGVVLHDWGKSRWFEALVPLYWLKERYDEEWIAELARILREQGADWSSFCDRWEEPHRQWTYETHIVNIGMMFKYEALCAAILGEEYTGEAEKLWRFLDERHGTAVGTFTGDEVLAGRRNNQGTELCSVAELMYSCEIMYRYTGDTVWADRLEKLSFNALPATLSDDMWFHQYDQMVNQIACVPFKGQPIFLTNGMWAHLFGLEPNYGCCTANFNQAWPKLAMNVFLRDSRGVTCAQMLPSELTVKSGEATVRVKIETEYPFRLTAKYTVTSDAPAKCRVRVRIPRFAKKFTVDGIEYKNRKYFDLGSKWDGEKTFVITLAAEPHFVSRPGKMKVVEYGPLVYSLPVKAEWKGHFFDPYVEEYRDKFVNWELDPLSEWRYGFDPDASLEVVEKDGCGVPFSSESPRIAIKTKLCPLDWDYAPNTDSVSALAPLSRKAVGKAVDVELVPYGATMLRMTEMPKAVK